MANIYDEQGNKDKAIYNYKKAIEINPKDLWGYANLACILEELNKNGCSFIYIDKALEISAKHYKILFNKGVILNKLNKTENSKRYYKNLA